MDILASYIAEHLLSRFTAENSRTFWGFLLSALALAFFVYVRSARREWSIKGFLAFAFPSAVWLHRSAKVDYVYFVLNGALMLLFFSPLLLSVYPGVVSATVGALSGLDVPSFRAPPWGVAVLYMVAVIAVSDFLIFLSHWLQHKVPVLWEFHKVHHAAEVLNPMTLYRQHPVDLMMSGAMALTGTAVVHGLFTYIFTMPFGMITIASLNLATLGFYVLGYNLRHSHIRLSFGAMDRWLISPEQHQLHHSCVVAHHDKNMGLIFAVWDRLFRCHYIPARDETIVLGLPDGESEDYLSGMACLWVPVRKALTRWKTGTLAVFAVAFGYAGWASAQPAWAPPSLHLEELTWTEVEEALANGYTRVILPTGGTEQNGPHVTLGKHNRIVRHTSESIARELGGTLIAPVIAYTPEGRINPPEGHMKYSGTISLSEETFQALVTDTARSLAQHGFKVVHIVGDSGQSVDAQDSATRAANIALRGQAKVFHVTDYYSANGQIAALRAQGYRDEAIGWHAGLRDTSELMAVAGDNVRADAAATTAQNQGANGAFWHASVEIGQMMLALKVDAAVTQIRALEAEAADAEEPSLVLRR